MKGCLTITALFFAAMLLLYYIIDYEPVTEAMNEDVHYEHSFFIRNFGDSAREEYETHGDTLIKHYIDLQAGPDDYYDRSFTTKSLFTITKNDTTVKGPYHVFEEGDYSFLFNKQALLNLCDSMIAYSSDSLHFKYIRNQVEPPPPIRTKEGYYIITPSCTDADVGNGIFRFAGGSTIDASRSMYGSDWANMYIGSYAIELLRKLPCKIEHSTIHTKPWAIVIQNFTGDDMGGIWYYAIHSFRHIVWLNKPEYDINYL